jgi:transcriptional regulator with XRE-family HTH domain
MGRTRRPQPKKLRKKLREIRLKKEFTQDEMAKQLRKFGTERAVHSGYVADFESGKREPSLLVVLAYAKLIGISTDVLIDDDIDLPDKLPGRPKHRVVSK